jgi:hypothetical protein
MNYGHRLVCGSRLVIKADKVNKYFATRLPPDRGV